MVRFDDVSKVRGRWKILEGIGFEARSGRMTGSVEPNGAGKSSSLQIPLSLDRATTGHATLDGWPCREFRNLPRRVSSMLNGAATHPPRTVRAYLGWAVTSNDIPRKRIQQVLEEVGLTADTNRRVGTCSLGTRQQLGLATTLLGGPERLALDEPINGLDPQGVRWIRWLPRAYTDAGGTVLLPSHLVGGLVEIVDGVVIINGGRIKAWGGMADIMASHPSLEEAFFAHVEARA